MNTYIKLFLSCVLRLISDNEVLFNIKKGGYVYQVSILNELLAFINLSLFHTVYDASIFSCLVLNKPIKFRWSVGKKT